MVLIDIHGAKIQWRDVLGHALESFAHVPGEFESVSPVLSNRQGKAIRTRDGR